VATYREHGHALVRGISARSIMAELYGKQEGCSRGRGGTASPRENGPASGDESEGQKARAEQHEADCGQSKKTVGDKVMMAHETPSLSDARPN